MLILITYRQNIKKTNTSQNENINNTKPIRQWIYYYCCL